ncbi:hypothetical protein IE4872_CH02964 [Rhizobium gallicum]|uniref:Uncharacterized protein n=1 Tax=Rhizobium gallicum TaxID=56730 RepID=A0A1L5NKY6_9HYPH|nr:hypothetical protein IE4872_CH02964 [Rhizobium gallicum]
MEIPFRRSSVRHRACAIPDDDMVPSRFDPILLIFPPVGAKIADRVIRPHSGRPEMRL